MAEDCLCLANVLEPTGKQMSGEMACMQRRQ